MAFFPANSARIREPSPSPLTAGLAAGGAGFAAGGFVGAGAVVPVGLPGGATGSGLVGIGRDRRPRSAFVFPAATVAGWLIGVALDRWLHTTWLYLAGLILGIIAGFVELIRAALSSESK